MKRTSDVVVVPLVHKKQKTFHPKTVTKKKRKNSREQKDDINICRRSQTLSHAIAHGTEERNRENLAKADDMHEYDHHHEVESYLWHVITTESEVIYPTNLKKYNGSVCMLQSMRWQAKIWCGPTMSFDTEDEAKEFVMKHSINEGTLKNIIYKFDDEYYCALTWNQSMLFSKESLEIVHNHTIFASYEAGKHKYYAQTKVNGKKVSFHNILKTPLEGQTIDHMNKSPMDNSLDNLRSVPWPVQNINKNYPTNTGVTGVSETKLRGVVVGYTACWVENGKFKNRYFSINKYGRENAFQMAVTVRKEKERMLHYYNEALSK